MHTQYSATKGLQEKTVFVESYLSAVNEYHRVSCDFELQTIYSYPLY